ncbi:glycosyltransferase family 4 protein [Paenarthrobacter sp. 22069]|uniref:glycosyltransferase family 4 protein n=1 Tax=Paenarthrobacter sp. 22069 TaxID=3453864 RepID=UPI003F824806
MKIALVHSFYSSDTPSGENNAVLAQVNALEARGHNVRLISKHTDELSAAASYQIRAAANVLFQRGPNPLNELEEFEPDIVHVHNLFPNYGRRWLDDWAGPLVATLHNFRPVCAAGTLYRAGRECTECPDFGSHRSIKHKCYRRSALKTIPLAAQTRSGLHGDRLVMRADRIIVLAERSYMKYKDLGLSEEKMVLLPNFVDQEGYRPGAPRGSHWTYIGRLTEEKGILNLLEAWPEEQVLRIVGDGPLRDVVVTRAAGMSNVHYVGTVSPSSIPNVLADSAGLVFSSEWPEGAPLVYVEALASGRPVVARRGSSVADDVARNGTGHVYSTSQELRQAVADVTQNWENFRAQCVTRHKEAYSVKAWASELENIYLETIDGQSAG